MVTILRCILNCQEAWQVKLLHPSHPRRWGPQLRRNIRVTCWSLLLEHSVINVTDSCNCVRDLQQKFLEVPRLWPHLRWNCYREFGDADFFANFTHLAFHASSVKTGASINWETLFSRPRVTHLQLNRLSHFPKMASLPSSLVDLVMYVESRTRSDGLGSDLDLDHLPVKLRSFDFSLWEEDLMMTQGLDHLPLSLTRLSLCGKFNQLLDHLPPTLQFLGVGGWTFNRPLDHLPRGLEELHLDSGVFNFPLDHLPGTLKKLRITSEAFQQGLDHFPPGLEILILRLHYSYPELDHLPKGLRELSFSGTIRNRLDHLPPNLTKLALHLTYLMPLDHLPSHLTHLTLGKRTKRREIEYSNTSNRTIRFFFDHLPASLTHLDLEGLVDLRCPLDHLPINLNFLSLPGQYSKKLDHLPLKLSRLRIGSLSDEEEEREGGEVFDQMIDHLPPCLTELRVGNQFDQAVDHLPSSLRILSLGRRFSQTIDHLPSELLDLILSNRFNHPLDHLPPFLQFLTFQMESEDHSFFEQSLEHLPRGVMVSICVV